jgi:hypothetical protein
LKSPVRNVNRRNVTSGVVTESLYRYRNGCALFPLNRERAKKKRKGRYKTLSSSLSPKAHVPRYVDTHVYRAYSRLVTVSEKIGQRERERKREKERVFERFY